MKKKKVVVIGLGYVGLPLVLLIKKKGHDVIGIDVDQQRLEMISRGISPITDRSVSTELKEIKIDTTNNYKYINDREIIIVCVPTPVNKDKSPDYSFIISASQSISSFLKKNQLIVIESTINPGTTEEIIIPILEKGSKLKAGVDFYISHIPERLNPGDKVWHVGNISRVVGGLNKTSLDKTVSFYQSILDAHISPLESLKEAEAVKMVENCFRDINIAFVNELAMSFTYLGINLSNVIRGASTKPFEFLAHYPGCGVGGHCVPVDPYYLIDYARKKGFEHHLLMKAREINAGMPRFTVEQLKNAIKEKRLRKKNIKVCLLGLTYKPNIQDTRESPAYEILKILQQESMTVSIHDPFVTKDSLDIAIKDAQAVIIATAHDEYISLQPEFFMEKGVQIVIDGRNCLNSKSFKQLDIIYKGIGC